MAIIKDLQTGEFSGYTSLNDLFLEMKADFLENNWSDRELVRLEADFETYTDANKIEFLKEVYDYEVIQEPDSDLIKQWEEQEQKKYEEEN